ncbi:uncharacterized protein LOC134585587, partial [Pelobates fuscus]|uniref:uncharacterized protein LOC134585587 n=1 Tax=Pelobates fuscus TaxID=191477 RepID=UPI002FE460DC
AMTDLFTSIVQTHNPTWDDCQQLLMTLFNNEERTRINQAAIKALEEEARTLNQANPAAWAATHYPNADPEWDVNGADMVHLKAYRDAIIAGMKAGGKKAINMSKTAEVIQKSDEPPSVFYDRLLEAYRLYTPFNPEAPENSRMINSAFVSQAYGDIKRKLQKLEGFVGMSITELMEVANKVYMNRESESKKEEERKMRKKADMLAVAIAGVDRRGPDRGDSKWNREPLSRNQCAYCREEGHWRSECPYMPECPVQLLGRDLLSKLQAQITFLPNGTTSLKFNGPSGIMTLSVPKEEEWRLYTALTSQNPKSDESLFNIPGVWAENSPPGLARNIPTIRIELKLGVYPVSLRQYHIPQKAKKNIQSYLDKFIRYGILKFCTSPWNTPLLPVQKPGTDEYRPVQDLRAVNDAVVSIHPVVPNPYNLLALIPGGATYFTVLDLKDAFFCLRIAAESQCIFAFQWENAVTGSKRQMTWTRLPQGFKNSPTLIGSALSQDLLDFKSIPGECVLLQYVDDLLIAAVTREICQQATHDLLHILWKAGYKVSRKKAQLCLPTVKYLGFHISEGQRIMGPERKEAVCQIPIPKNRRQVREFLGAAGFCRIWIPSYAILAKPLYAAIKGTEHDPFLWTPEQQKAFEDVKKALMSAPALGLPDHTRPFYLYVHEQRRMAVGVLTQYLGSWQRPVAYMSKQLDAVASGLPPCLRAVAAAALLVAEANKLTLGQELYVGVPHAVQTLLDYKGNHWFSNSRMTKYQAMLCENPRVHLETVNALNPATLLPQPTESQHDCLEVMDEVFSSRPDLRDFPIQNPDVQYYTDGSSYVKEGIRYAGYAVTTIDKVIEARPLSKGTSAQKAELIALTRALQLAEGLRVNIYTDSKYAFLTTHAHGALYKERGLLNSEGKEIKYAAEILQLLEHLPVRGTGIVALHGDLRSARVRGDPRVAVRLPSFSQKDSSLCPGHSYVARRKLDDGSRKRLIRCLGSLGGLDQQDPPRAVNLFFQRQVVRVWEDVAHRLHVSLGGSLLLFAMLPRSREQLRYPLGGLYVSDEFHQPSRGHEVAHVANRGIGPLAILSSQRPGDSRTHSRPGHFLGRLEFMIVQEILETDAYMLQRFSRFGMVVEAVRGGSVGILP